MPKDLGIDIIEVDRIRGIALRQGKKFLERAFSQKEISYCLGFKDPYPHFAARFAAKEAFLKAHKRLPPLSFREIEILNDHRGKPGLFLNGKKQGEYLISLSHTEKIAVAIVFREGKNQEEKNEDS